MLHDVPLLVKGLTPIDKIPGHYAHLQSIWISAILICMPIMFSDPVPAKETDTFPDSPGLYLIWSPDGNLLYVGKSKTTGLRNRMQNYLHYGPKKRPNETLYLYIIDHVRPNLQEDSRSSVTIAVEYLQHCTFSFWVWDESAPLGELENSIRREHQPALNALPHH